ncbi:MAG: threonine/serine exporter family protein [Alphaproteobacteria bacterium]|nr:threonine/serine exporter family protein [Alphaproteobacteria bacterium]
MLTPELEEQLAAVDLRAPRAELLTRLAGALHEAGAPSHQLEATVRRLGGALGVRTSVFAQPTSLFLEVDGQVRMLRVEPRDVALDRLVALDALAQDLVDGRLTASAAAGVLDHVADSPSAFGRGAQLAAWAGAGGAAAVFFGGGGAELILAAATSAVVGALSFRRSDSLARTLPLVGAVFTGLVAACVAAVLPLRVDVVVLSGLIVLLPGFTLTVGLTELANRHLAAGSARLASAGITFLQLGVGVAVAEALAVRLVPAALPAVGVPLPGWADALALIAAAVSFLVLFRARGRDLLAIVGIALLAVHGSRGAVGMLGPEAGAFAGAMLVALAANVHARVRRVPASLLLVPGIIMLVPGSLGFRGVHALVGASVAAPLDGSLIDGARMFVVGAALAAGVVVAGGLLPSRRTL